jgi:hypothetical protein
MQIAPCFCRPAHAACAAPAFLPPFPLPFALRRVTNGCIMETNKGNILKPILWLEKISK